MMNYQKQKVSFLREDNDSFQPSTPPREAATVSAMSGPAADSVLSAKSITSPMPPPTSTSRVIQTGAGSTSSSEDDYDEDSKPLDTRHLFARAYDCLQPSSLFRNIVYLYAERRMHLFFWMHGMATLVVWIHFFLIKYRQQMLTVPKAAPFYNWKTLAPPLEFATMHAILLQMAMLPLTMCRFTIASLSPTWLRCYVPLNRAVNTHIYLGYLLITFVFMATMVFVMFFGIICASGDQVFCDKFTSTIMITGYVILAFFLTIGATSYFRHSIPYEVFYVMHHSVFILYALTIAHTLDKPGASKSRAQTFKWFSLTILYYICDRSAMHFFHSYRTRMASCSSVVGAPGPDGRHITRLLLIKLHRPPLFQFHPGQYAYLKVARIDSHWHPFSIASDPLGDYLEFYVECCGVDSWTDRLWNMVQEGRLIDFEIQGPVGTCLDQTQEYSHALAIGSGAGIVPVLSMFKQHVRQLMRLDPHTHFKERKNLQMRVESIQREHECRKGSIVQQLIGSNSGHNNQINMQTSKTDSLKQEIKKTLCRHNGVTNYRDRDVSLKMFKCAAYKTTRSIYGVVCLSFLAVFGIGLIGFTISWNTLTFDLPYKGMFPLLHTMTYIFQALFFVVAVAIWDANSFFAYTDTALSIIAPFADWYWFGRPDLPSKMLPADIATYCLLTGYMAFRIWGVVAKPRSTSWRVFEDDSRTLERLDVIWVSRSASLVSEIIPDISAIWQELVNAWGLENAKSVCRFNIYVTDKDKSARRVLKTELSNTILYKNGFVHFGRPDLDKAIEDHSIELIEKSNTSNTLLVYVGSPQLASMIHECKLFNDMKVAITGNKKHQMEFVSESYGGFKSCKPKKPQSDQLQTDSSGDPSPSDVNEMTPRDDELALTQRHTVSFEVSEEKDFGDVSFEIRESPKRTMESPVSSAWSKTSV